MHKDWTNLALNYTRNHDLVNELWQEIARHYQSNRRFYHNLHHIKDLLEQAETLISEFDDTDMLKFAIWYHDIVYRVTRNDNEEKSAQLAVHRLTDLEINEDRREACRNQILATKSHRPEVSSHNSDIKWIIDFDLAVLGRPWEEYLTYTRKIRKEYQIFPDFLYKPGRKKVLEKFLARERIFQTATYYDRFEEQARSNIEQEMDLIS